MKRRIHQTIGSFVYVLNNFKERKREKVSEREREINTEKKKA